MIDSGILDRFKPISLEEMGKVRLMNRVDSKFITDVGGIEKLLDRVAGTYLMQEIEGKRNMPYYTRYFDTEGADMFYQHQRGRKTRQKVRVRHYEDCGVLPYIEIKRKNNKGRTNKKRVEMKEGDNLQLYGEFLSRHSSYEAENLKPCIENHFYRITLVDEARTERITIDTALEFHNLANDRRAALQNIGIIEWKRDGRNRNSEFGRILRELRIKQSGFSKYCIGMALTDPGLRQNRLKPKLRKIERILK